MSERATVRTKATVPDSDAFVAETWELYGRTIQALKDDLMVRTHPVQSVSKGGIILPTNEQTLHGGLPKGVHVWATVVSKGSLVDSVDVGDRVMFLRLDFAWIHKFRKDGTLLGKIKEDVLMMSGDPDDE